jgi:hypothetical protein
MSDADVGIKMPDLTESVDENKQTEQDGSWIIAVFD